MSKKLTLALLSVTVRRDAQTIPVVTVPEHEIPILRRIFGKENITKGNQVGTVELDPELEQERLSNKYGAEVVMAVHGDDNGERLAELMEKGVTADKPAAKTASKRQPAAGEGASE